MAPDMGRPEGLIDQKLVLDPLVAGESVWDLD